MGCMGHREVSPGPAAKLRTLACAVRSELARRDVSFVAAGLTFYAAIAVVPLMLSTLYLAGLLVGQATIVSLSEQVIAYAPNQLGLQPALTALRDVGPGLGAVSFVAALIPATTYGERAPPGRSSPG